MDKCPQSLEIQEQGRGHCSQEDLQREDTVDFSEKGHADVHAGRRHAAAVVEVILDGRAGIARVRVGHVASSARPHLPRPKWEPTLTTTAFTHFRDGRQTELAELPLCSERRTSRSLPWKSLH